MALTERRKLLTAAVGVATVSYVLACGGIGGDLTSGNLVAAGGSENGNEAGSGGSGGAAGSNVGGAAGFAGSLTSGNLVAPPPPACCLPVDPVLDAGAADAAVPSADAAADAAPAAEDAAVDSAP